MNLNFVGLGFGIFVLILALLEMKFSPRTVNLMSYLCVALAGIAIALSIINLLMK